MKKHLLITAITLWSGTLLATSSLHKAPEPSTPANYATTLKAAKTAYKQALARKNAWRDTGKLIKSAEQAAQQGDMQRANKLAEQARQQGQAAIIQSQEQADVGNPSYLQ
jgi:hypothetical protein